MSVSIASPREMTEQPWYTQLWPWLLILGPTLVVIAGGFTMWLAFRSQDALVVGDYYKEGMAINQDLRRDRVAERLGLSATLEYDASAGKLKGKLVKRGGAPYAGSLVLRLVHSTLPDKDIVLNVQTDANGNFAVPLPMLDMARWQIVMENESREWRLDGEWLWPHERKAVLEPDAGGHQ